MAASGEGTVATEEQVKSLTELISKLRASGNDAFRAKQYSDAVRLYSDGINAAMAIRDHVSRGDISTLLSNRAAVKLTTGDFVGAVDDSRRAIEVDPTNVKAYFRAAKGSLHLDLYQQAVDFCEEGLKCTEGSADLSAMHSTCMEKLRSYSEAKTLESRGFTEDDAVNCQNQVKEISEQHYLLKQKIHSCEFEGARNHRSASLLAEMGDVTCYKAMGRAFVSDSKPALLQGLSARNSELGSELEKLNETLKVIEGRKLAAEKEMHEIVEFFRRKQPTRK